MSKIIVVTVPVEGHFNPFVPIITRLVQNGHDVICFAGRKFQKRVENTGATFLPPPLKWDTSIQETYDVFPELRNKSGLAQLKLYIKLVMFDPVPDLINELKGQIDNFQPDLIISDTFLIVGSWVTEFYNIPSVRISVLPLNIPGKNIPPKFRFIGPIITPPNVNYKKPEWWPEIEKDIPVVLINQGTVSKDYDDLILPSIEALKNEKIIVIAVPVKEGEIMNLPENVHTELYIPFGNLLPHIDLLITNGGFGGTQNALAYGIPIIIAGATEDKMEVAARLEYSGAGINLRNQQPTSKKIMKAYRKIMSDHSYKQKANELKEHYAKFDAPVLAVSMIEELIKKHSFYSSEAF
jgi:UDP:flavonoid glycosyltransferase YjiC (YdhE family)